MRTILMILLVLLFGYAIALVLQNGSIVPVDLLFSQVPAMRLGLLLVLTLVLGIALGLLLSLQVFRVFQSQWEIKRLRKDIDKLRKEQIAAAQQAAHDAALQSQLQAKLQEQQQASTQKDAESITNENKSPL